MQKLEAITLHIGHVVYVEVTPLIEQVIQTAKLARQAGLSKVEAVRKIYPAIANLEREAIWYAFIQGVDLSSRGAVTYYYNMRNEWKSK